MISPWDNVRILAATLVSTIVLLVIQPIQARGQDADRSQALKPSPRFSTRELSEWVAQFEQATVADGFVIQLYSDRQAKRFQRQFREYSAKHTLLRKHLTDIQLKLPDVVVHNASRVFQRCDRNADNYLDDQEIAFLEGMIDIQKSALVRQQAKDGRVEKADLVFTWLNTSTDPRNHSDLSQEDVRELLVQTETARKRIDELRAKNSQAIKFGGLEYYHIQEVTRDFIRLRKKDHQRVIPINRVLEFRDALPE